MLTIACFKWNRPKTGYQLPAVCDYTADHVNTLGRMLERHLTIPYEFVAITDDPTGIECRTIPLWDDYRHLGGCYTRLKVFDKDFDLLGDRFALIDLDVVITGNCDHIFGIDADFAIHAYDYPDRPNQRYNGALIVMDRGARPQVWDEFSEATPALMSDDRTRIGSDQKWISTVLGPGETRLGPADGVFEALPIRGYLPSKAAMVFFSGKRDPSQRQYPWVKEHYR